MTSDQKNPPGPIAATPRSPEPRRLVDDPDVGVAPSARWALDLLRAASPYQAPPGRKQRVQLGLGHSRARRASLVLRAVVVACVLIGCGTVARAALGRWPGWLVQAYQLLVPPAATPDHTPARTLAPAPAEPGPRVRQPLDSLPAVTESQAPAAGRATVPPRAGRAAPPHGANDDTSPVLEAMRALRVERNPVRARVLLAGYLDQHPGGTLAEEALAMTIEAAVAHRDADVGALAARYLRQYPEGHFLALARQAGTAAPGATRK